MLITDPISAIDAIVHRTRARGIVKGSGTDCKLEYIEKRSDIEIGDKVISSGKDGFYPKGIVIGTIKDVSFNGGMQSATITPEVNIDALEEVIIIKINMNEISMYEKDK